MTHWLNGPMTLLLLPLPGCVTNFDLPLTQIDWTTQILPERERVQPICVPYQSNPGFGPYKGEDSFDIIAPWIQNLD